MKTHPDDDPVLASSRREALLVGVVWLGAIVYTTTYCYRNCYGRTAESLLFVLGFPDWVFWGIILPWGLCLAFTGWFAFGIMSDHIMDEDLPDDPSHGDPATRADDSGIAREGKDAGGSGGA